MSQPNALIHTTSPYLLQHAYNPIQWYPWCKEALAKAQKENKPILLSVGYAACHWCHVMARESFEEEEIAAIMNQHFICIKVDREERPDIDQVYIAAVQAMGIHAGWPLHVFLLPNQQPFYGGTYFPPPRWKQILKDIVQAFENHRQQLEESAVYFTKALQLQQTSTYSLENPPQPFTKEDIQSIFENIYQHMDHQRGGMQGSPKFPMPSLHAFLLDYYRLIKEERALQQLQLTLQNLAYGGIYDQLCGGFARYATDEAWNIPHFEKMLYDNAQLISLYAHTYLVTPHPLYKKIIEETISFVIREMMDASSAFYSAIDADTDGIEGKFYTWTKAEVESILGQDAPLIMQYFNMQASGNWEKGYNILYRSLDESSKIPDLNQEAIQIKILEAQEALLYHRNQRKKPTLDDKILTSWNGMMLQALIDAYYALGDTRYLDLAKKNASFLAQHLLQKNQLYHSYRQGRLGVEAYLEDYAWIIKAWVSLYQATFEEAWLHKAYELTCYTRKHYWDATKQLFYFTDEKSNDLISRPQEIFDQVIPSSNAVMTHNLFELGILLDQPALVNQAIGMLKAVTHLLIESPLYLSHWASFYIKQIQEPPTIAILGPDYLNWAYIIKQKYPQAMLLGALHPSNLSILMDKKAINGQSTIYICFQKTCLPPIQSLTEALQQLNNALVS